MTPVEQAMARGHKPEWDPPHGLSRAERWTCWACGAAVLRYGDNVYGSAIEQDCTAKEAGS